MEQFQPFREAFPILDTLTWLATPSCAPAAAPVIEALQGELEKWTSTGLDWPRYDEAPQATRQQFAALTGLDVRGVALLQSVAQGASTIAAHLSSRDRVVVGAEEYRSTLYPWLAVEARGVQVDQVPMAGGELPSSAVIERITDDTTLVALSVVQSATGYRTDLEAVAERCTQVGARLFLDATQSAGILRLPPNLDPDYVTVHGYKWLACPRGASWLYVRPDHLPELSPIAPGHKSTERPWAEFYGGPLDFAHDARKLDMSLGWPAWAGARAALQLIATLNPDDVERHCLDLADRFRQEATSRGLRPLPTERPSHIVSIRSVDAGAAVQALHAHGVRATARAGTLRFGFHAFNDHTDIKRLLTALEAIT